VHTQAHTHREGGESREERKERTEKRREEMVTFVKKTHFARTLIHLTFFIRMYHSSIIQYDESMSHIVQHNFTTTVKQVRLNRKRQCIKVLHTSATPERKSHFKRQFQKRLLLSEFLTEALSVGGRYHNTRGDSLTAERPHGPTAPRLGAGGWGGAYQTLKAFHWALECHPSDLTPPGP